MRLGLNLLLASGLVCTAAASGAVELADGGDHVIASDVYAADRVDVRDALDGSPTKLVVSSGSVIRYLVLHDHSELVMEGGRLVDGLTATDDARVTVAGGIIDGVYTTGDRSVHRIRGGEMRVLRVSGGTSEIEAGHVDAIDATYGRLIIRGGEFGGLDPLFQSLLVSGWARCDVYGGRFLAPLRGRSYGGQLRIVGSAFAVDGLPVPFGLLLDSGSELSGVLASGEALAAGFSVPIELVRAVDVDVGPLVPWDAIVLHRGLGVRVALLGSVDLDVRAVDRASLGFGPAEAPPLHPPSIWDVDRDGALDLVADFDPVVAGLSAETAHACLTGLADDLPFAGCDRVRVRHARDACGLGFELALLLGALSWARRRRAASSPRGSFPPEG